MHRAVNCKLDEQNRQERQGDAAENFCTKVAIAHGGESTLSIGAKNSDQAFYCGFDFPYGLVLLEVCSFGDTASATKIQDHR
jgi:hypothetical protein